MKNIQIIILSMLLFVVNLIANEITVKGELLIQMTQAKSNSRTLAKTLPSKLDGIVSKYKGKSEAILKSDIKSKPLQNGALGKTIAQEKLIIKVTDIEKGDIENMTEEIKQIDGVQYVEPNYIFRTDDFDTPTTNPKETEQWYLNKNNVKDAWNLFTQDDINKLQNVVVAVLDSGVDYIHEDLKDAMWVNSGEIPGNGVDDDGNGYTDDVHGANVLYKTLNSTSNAIDTDPKDDHGHGTHVAGIIGATNNDLGIIGIASGVKIMAIKCARADGSLTTEDIVKALEYARDMGAHIANMSFGGGMHSNILENALADLSATATLIASAGNSAKPLELDDNNVCGMQGIKPVPNYPAAYPFVLGVEASDSMGNKAGFSNCDPKPYSELEYEVRLPGVGIMSTLPGDTYASWNGTSMAAPVASALAALVKVKNWDKQDIFTNRMVQAQVAKYSSNFSDALTQLPTPDLKYFAHTIYDPDGDADAIADAGETVKLAIQLKNYWGAAKDIKLKVSPGFTISGTSTFSADDYVTIKDSNGDNGSKTVDLAQIGSYTIGDNGIVNDEYGNITDVTIPIELVVDPSAPNLHRVVFSLEAEYNNAIDDSDTATYTLASKQFSFDLQNGIEVQGAINSDTTWSANSRIIVKEPLLIAEGVRLTIEEGVEVRFEPNTFMKVNGTVRANGTKENKILFTANSKDLSKKTTWCGLNFNCSSIDFTTNGLGSIVNYSIIEKVIYSNSSHGITNGSVALRGKNVQVNNTIFRSSHDPISLTGYYASGWQYNGWFNNILIDYNNNYWAGFGTLNINGDYNNSLFYGFSHFDNDGEFRLHEGSEYLNSAYLIENTEYPGKLVLYSKVEDSSLEDISERLYIGGYRSSFKDYVKDYNDAFDSDYMFLGNTNEEMLAQTMPTPPSTTPAFLVSAQWLDSSDIEKQVLEVGSTYKLRLTFNKEKMQTGVQPLVTFGSLEPYTDKTIKGSWIDTDGNGLAKVWEATYKITSHSGSGENTIRVTGAFDDDMYYDAPVSEVYKFSIIASGAQAMVLQAVGGNGKADITWMQDDYEMVGGYNVYRADTQDGTYSKINSTPILGLTYTDTAVQPGETYYYTFKAILSDGSLSPDSNIASATILDNVKPTITHTPVLKVHPGNSQRITTTVTDNILVSDVKLYYKVVGGGTFIEADMVSTSIDNQYAYTIASSYFNDGANLEYKIEATDNSGNTQETLVNTINVTSGDVAPLIAQVSDITLEKNSASQDIYLTIVDADAESFTVSAVSSDSSIVSVNYSSSNNKLTISPQVDKHGAVTITIKATNALETTMSFNVTITHEDQLPVLQTIDNVSKLKDFDTFTIPVVASDPDGDNVELAIENSNDNIITVNLVGTDIEISSVAYAVGQSTIKVTATANGKSVTKEFLVEVLLNDSGSNQVFNYQLNKGWNLIGFLPQNSIDALPVELKDENNVRIIWQYDNVGKVWKGYSPITTYAELLKDQAIQEINAIDGIWINCKEATVVTLKNPPSASLTEKNILNYSGWSLVSSGDNSSIDPNNLTGVDLVWKYKNGEFELFSTKPEYIQQANNLNIKTFNSIAGSEGFWIYK